MTRRPSVKKSPRATPGGRADGDRGRPRPEPLTRGSAGRQRQVSWLLGQAPAFPPIRAVACRGRHPSLQWRDRSGIAPDSLFVPRRGHRLPYGVGSMIPWRSLGDNPIGGRDHDPRADPATDHVRRSLIALGTALRRIQGHPADTASCSPPATRGLVTVPGTVDKCHTDAERKFSPTLCAGNSRLEATARPSRVAPFQKAWGSRRGC